jgi:hypothetical protein
MIVIFEMQQSLMFYIHTFMVYNASFFSNLVDTYKGRRYNVFFLQDTRKMRHFVWKLNKRIEI